MKVSELIAILQQCDGDKPVTVLVYDGRENSPDDALEAAIRDRDAVTREGGGAAPEYFAINCVI